jgi:hypothetical protein
VVTLDARHKPTQAVHAYDTIKSMRRMVARLALSMWEKREDITPDGII